VFVGSILTFRALFMPSSGPLQESKSISFILAQWDQKALSFSHTHTEMGPANFCIHLFNSLICTQVAPHKRVCSFPWIHSQGN
jgi:hypothetical protein